MWCPHFNLVPNHRCKFSQHNSKYFSFSFSSCSIAALCAAQVDPTRYIYCFVLLLWFVYINHGEQIFTRFPPLPILLPTPERQISLPDLHFLQRWIRWSVFFLLQLFLFFLKRKISYVSPHSPHHRGCLATPQENAARKNATQYLLDYAGPPTAACLSRKTKKLSAIISTRCKCITLVAEAQDLNYDTVSFGVFFF